jgi:CheY-like chemotaxis protein
LKRECLLGGTWETEHILFTAAKPGCDGCHILLWITRLFVSHALTNFSPDRADKVPKVREEIVKILLVEDSLAIRQENERVLLKAGYEVVCAKDGVAALKLAKTEHPELILLDMILPKMSGPEGLTQLKKNSATTNIPVIVLSSLSEKNRQKLIEAGADEYLEKPSLSPTPGTNLLPKILEDVICRINRKRGIALSSIPVDKAGV